MLQAQRLEMFEETAAQVVDHALAGIDLDLRGVCGHEMVDDLQQHPADDDQDEHHDQVFAGDRLQPPAPRLAERMLACRGRCR